MALYRENATGFIQEWATNPGAGYTAISAQPTDTLTNRVNWWRSADIGSLSSAWHPSLQGGTEVPAPPGVNGSGVNVMAWRYSSFEEMGDLGYDGLPPFTTELGTVTATRPASVTGYHGNYRLRLTWGTTGAKIWMGQLVTAQQIELYNIKLTTNRRWIISLYVAPTTTGAKAFNVLLTTKSVAGATAEYTTALSTGATSGTWTRVSFGLDLSADSGNKAVLGFSASSGIIIDVDGIMIEEWVGSLATPSAYTAVTAFVTGEQLVDVAVDKLKAGTITSQTIILADTTAAIKSANWSAGGNGFIIRGDGTCEFGQVTVRGAVNAGSITGGTLNCSNFTVSNLNAGAINTGTLNCANFTVSNLSASSINTGTLNCASLTVTNFSASSINTGILNCANFTVSNLNAGSITAGTLSVDRLATNSINGVKLGTGSNGVDTQNLVSNAVTTVTAGYSDSYSTISNGSVIFSATLPANANRGTVIVLLAGGFDNLDVMGNVVETAVYRAGSRVHSIMTLIAAGVGAQGTASIMYVDTSLYTGSITFDVRLTSGASAQWRGSGVVLEVKR